jgi:hypothetical protein
MTDASVTVDRLLHTPGRQLDDLFRRSPSDRIPSGAGDGTVIFAPDSPVALLTAGLVRLLARRQVLRFVLDFTNAKRGRPMPDAMKSSPGTPGGPDKPYRDSPFWRVFDTLALRLDHRRGWYRLPRPLGLLTLAPALRSAVNAFTLWQRTGPFTQEG